MLRGSGSVLIVFSRSPLLSSTATIRASRSAVTSATGVPPSERAYASGETTKALAATMNPRRSTPSLRPLRRRRSRLARVGRHGDLPWDATSLSNHVVPFPLRHDLLDVGDVVARNDREVRGVGPELLVRLGAHRNLLGARSVSALADQDELVRDRRERLVQLTDSFVRLSKDGFVEPDASLAFLHGRASIYSSEAASCSNPSSGFLSSRDSTMSPACPTFSTIT